MKKILLSFTLIIILASTALGSVTLIMPNRSGLNGTQITIPVKVKDYINIVSAQGTIQFNPAIVSYSSVQQFGLSGMSTSNFGTTQVAAGKLTLSYFDATLMGQTLPDSAILFSITFNIIGSATQVSSLSFINSPTLMELTDNSFTPQTLVLVDGSISVSSGVVVNDLSVYADTITSNSGTQVSISVRAKDFTHIISYQGTLQFNPAVATYAGISYFGLPGLSIGNFGTSQVGSGKLMFNWNDATLIGKNLADDAAMFTVLFDVVGTPGSQTNIAFVDTPTPVEFVDSVFNTLTVGKTAGRIKVRNSASTDHLIYYCDSASAPNGSIVTVAMHAIDFINIISMQGTLQFNPAVASLDTIDYYGLPSMSSASFGLSQVASGKIMFSWNDPTLLGITKADSAIMFSMKFQLTGTPGTFTMLNFVDSPVVVETVDKNFATLNDSLISGKLRIINNGTITVNNPATLSYCMGSELTTTYTITGTFITGNLFILQISNASGSFASPVNLDTVVGISSGTFNCYLPLTLPAGAAYRLRVISTNPVLTSATSTQDISIIATPGFPSLPTGSTQLCLNPSNTTYTSTATNVTAAQWSLYPGSAGSISGTGGTATVDWDNSYIGNAYIKVMGINGSCPGPWSDSLMVTISDYPAAGIKPIGDSLMCQNSGTTAYTTTAILNADTYVWQLNPGSAGSISGSGTTINITWNAAYTGVAQLTVYGVHSSCNGSTSAPLSIQVLAIPAKPTTPAGTSVLCINSANTNYSTTAVSNATNYIWTLVPAAAGTLTPSGINASIDWNNAYTGHAHIIVAAINNICQGTTSDTLTVLINDVPAQAAKPTGSVERCSGTGSDVYTTAGASGATSYIWGISPPAAGSITGTTTTATVNWNAGWDGTAQIFVTAANSCGNGIKSDSLAVSVHPLPVAPIISTTLGVLSSSYSSGNQWYFNNGILVGETNQDHTPLVNGNYFVIYTDGNGCWSSSDTLNVNFVGIEDADFASSISLVPNPTDGNFVITGNEIQSVEISTLGGKMLIKYSNISNDVLNVDFAEFASGLYLVKVTTPNTVRVFRLVKK